MTKDKLPLPFFSFYVNDFMAEASHLSNEEAGVYIRLLCLCWSTPGCSIPKEPGWFYRKLRAEGEHDRKVVNSVVDEFFERQGNRLHNLRLTKENTKARDQYRKKCEAGSKGGKAKALKYRANATGRTIGSPQQPQQESESEPEPELQSKPEPTSDDFVFGLNGWGFKRKEVSAMKGLYPELNIEAKLKQPSFLEWAEKENPADPKRVISNFFKGQSRKYNSEVSLGEAISKLNRNPD